VLQIAVLWERGSTRRSESVQRDSPPRETTGAGTTRRSDVNCRAGRRGLKPTRCIGTRPNSASPVGYCRKIEHVDAISTQGMFCIALAQVRAAAYSTSMSRRYSPRSLLPCGVVFVIALTSCGGSDDVGAAEGGQTGSAGCDPSPRCICDATAGAEVVRGVFHSDDSVDATVEVLEVFGADADTSAGETLSGPYQVGFPCGFGSVEPVVEGQEVLAVRHPPTTNDGMLNMYVMGWSETLWLTPRLELPSSEATVLAEPEACADRFPDEDPPCDNEF
jgi:hypothetical protein